MATNYKKSEREVIMLSTEYVRNEFDITMQVKTSTKAYGTFLCRTADLKNGLCSTLEGVCYTHTHRQWRKHVFYMKV